MPQKMSSKDQDLAMAKVFCEYLAMAEQLAEGDYIMVVGATMKWLSEYLFAAAISPFNMDDLYRCFEDEIEENEKKNPFKEEEPPPDDSPIKF